MDDSELKIHFEDFLKRFKSLCISSINIDGWPMISYAPFVVDENRIYHVFLSDLSKQTHCLRESRKASIMLIEDEESSSQIFARNRVIFECDVRELEDGVEATERILDKMQKEFGELLSTLRSLKDFHLFQLKPRVGSFVMGFGKAYDVYGDKMDLLEPVRIKKRG